MKALVLQSKSASARASTGPSYAESSEPKTAAILAKLKEVFGYDSLRGHQEAAIRAALQGKDSFVLMPTGGGKSLCYTMPALMFNRQLVIVVSPLIALMQDQVGNLKSRGVPAAYLASAQDKTTRQIILSSLENNLKMQPSQGQPSAGKDGGGNTLRMLYVTPELLATPGFQQQLRLLKDRSQLGLIAVDEAHCISSWGHDFRPAYRKVSYVRALVPGVPIMALTATATSKVRQDILQQLALHDPLILISTFNRPNITYSVHLLDTIAHYHRQQQAQQDDGGFVQALAPVLQQSAGPGQQSGFAPASHLLQQLHDDEGFRADGGPGGWNTAQEHSVDVTAMQQLKQLLSQYLAQQEGCAIVYVHRRADADGLIRAVGRVSGRALRCAAYHAGLGDKERKLVMDQWMHKQLDLVAATVAFGMGIDRADVRLVVHWCIPQTVEGYYQESGRAGRDGLPAHAALFYRRADRERIEYILCQEAKKQEASKAKRRKLGPGSPAAASDRETADGALPDGHTITSFNHMVRYATEASCRRRYLLAHFHEQLLPGQCQGCDVCDNRQAVEESVSLLALLDSQASTRQSTYTTDHLINKASGQRRARPPPGTYGADQIQESDGDDGDEAEEEEDAQAQDADALAAEQAAALAAARAQAVTAQAGGGGGGGGSRAADPLGFLQEMERLEELHERKQQGGGKFSGLLSSLTSRTDQAASAAHQASTHTAAEITQESRASARQALHKKCSASCCCGWKEASLQLLVSSLEEAILAGCDSHRLAAYNGRVRQHMSRMSSHASFLDVLAECGVALQPPQTHTPAASSSAQPVQLKPLLAAEVAALQALAHRDPTDPNRQKQPVVSSERLMARLTKLADLHVTKQVIEGPAALGVGALRKHESKALAEAAKKVVDAWKKQLS